MVAGQRHLVVVIASLEGIIVIHLTKVKVNRPSGCRLFRTGWVLSVTGTALASGAGPTA